MNIFVKVIDGNKQISETNISESQFKSTVISFDVMLYHQYLSSVRSKSKCHLVNNGVRIGVSYKIRLQ